MPIISSISAIQVAECLKLLVGDAASLHRSLMQIDIWKNEWRSIRMAEPDPDCVCCGKGVYEFLDAEAQEFSAVLCGRNAVQIAPAKPSDLDLKALAQKLSAVPEIAAADIKQNEYLLRFTIDGHEITVFRDARAIIKNTDDPAQARSIYSRYIGS